MRVSGQLAVIALLGAAGVGGWYAYQGGYLAKTPVIGGYVAEPGPQAGAWTAGAALPGPATVEVDTVKTGRVVEVRESVGTVRAFESITVTASVAGTSRRSASRKARPSRPATCSSTSMPTSGARRSSRPSPRRTAPRRSQERNRHQARAGPGAEPNRRRNRRAGRRPDGTGEIARQFTGVGPGAAQSRRGKAGGAHHPGAFRGTRRDPLGVAWCAMSPRNPRHLPRRSDPRPAAISPCPKTFSAASRPARPSMPRRLPIGAGFSRAWFRPSTPVSIRPPARSA